MDETDHELGLMLAQLGAQVRHHLVISRDLAGDGRPVGHRAGDTIFVIDQKVEPIVAAAIEAWPNWAKPLLLTAEGFGLDGHRRFGDPNKALRYRMLVDPIDGTRSLMYDKRAAWFLAAIAPDRGEDTRLSHCLASAMVELPTSKQSWADTFIAVRDAPVLATRSRLDGGASYRLMICPSGETSLFQGFGHVVSYFPGTKVLAADLLETIVNATLGPLKSGGAPVFDDQYISTGGQMVEMLLGHDRFCCDMRPLFHDILATQASFPITRGLECHPYDLAGMLVALQGGIVLTDGFGKPLDPGFGVDQGVHWCGYANEGLRRQIEPVIQDWLHSRLNGTLATVSKDRLVSSDVLK